MKRTENKATDSSMNAPRTCRFSAFRQRVIRSRVSYAAPFELEATVQRPSSGELVTVESPISAKSAYFSNF